MADIAVIGDVSDINCWSNIPYYFFQAGKDQSLFENPWKLDDVFEKVFKFRIGEYKNYRLIKD